jgi:hypothetical protein
MHWVSFGRPQSRRLDPLAQMAAGLCQRLLELVSDVDFGASAEQRLANMNRVAASDLLH